MRERITCVDVGLLDFIYIYIYRERERDGFKLHSVTLELHIF